MRCEPALGSRPNWAQSSLESRFTGHEACRNSSRDWLYGLKISLFGSGTQAEPMPDVIARYNPRPGVTADFVSDSFHPTKTDQSAYAATFEAVYFRAFT